MVAARSAADLVARLEPRRCAPLLPAVAEVAARAGAEAVGLVALGPAGLETHLDRVAVTYAYRTGDPLHGGDGFVLGDPTSPVRASCTVVGPGRLPARVLPRVVARVRLDPDPRAPDAGGDDAGGDDGVRAVLAEPAVLVRAGLVDGLPAALDLVPDGVLPVVVTAWTVARLRPADRRRFREGLGAAAGQRPLAWVAVEGVGVAPGVPTLGDRPASGHSLVGVALLDGPRSAVETVGRCWSRGRLLSWLAPPG